MTSAVVVATPLPSSQTAPAPKKSCQPLSLRVETAGRPLNIRASSNLNAPVVGTIPNGTLIAARTLDPGKHWAAITTPSGGSGWVSTDYLTLPNQPGKSFLVAACTFYCPGCPFPPKTCCLVC
ncbi:hypothetical protein DO97_20055 [Neosynechococcus sphagnicola sy1]|uniref:SH3b domain-containing protein n=1 Tax=Neosynechococcus sphagnicola sy1 TaxID=1497020 RepID=A0A098TM94_9CYAN|nr:SH3 domain-containing protein [Neosynechococcus sphagnicola]KGF73386.1 hypothetical protein DO97_20055 [Neosynechococcus sphagnicola sy1]